MRGNIDLSRSPDAFRVSPEIMQLRTLSGAVQFTLFSLEVLTSIMSGVSSMLLVGVLNLLPKSALSITRVNTRGLGRAIVYIHDLPL